MLPRNFISSISKRPLHDLQAVCTIPYYFQSWPTVYRHFRSVQGFTASTAGPHVTVALRGGPLMTVRSNTIDLEIVHDTFSIPGYDQPDCKVHPTDRTIVDIGGHIGSFTLLAAQRAPQARIIAVEPDPDNAALLRQNVAQNNFSNVEVFEGGLSDTSGTATLFRSPIRSCDHRLTTRPWEGVPVSILTLQDLFEKYRIETCDFMKIDAEEAEFPILLSAPDALLKRINRIALEYHRAEYPQLVERLQAVGFTVRVESGSADLGMMYATRVSSCLPV